MAADAQSVWNSLEIAKLAVGALTPISVAFLAGWLTRQSAKADKKRARAEETRALATARYSKVVEKRVELWDQLGPLLNQIYCYLLEVGNWQALKAAQALGFKRDADRIFYAYRPFFTEAFAAAYARFMNESFQIYNAPGTAAMLRAGNANHADPEGFRFTGEDNSASIYDAYFGLLKLVGSELDLEVVVPSFEESDTGQAHAAAS